MLLFSRRLVALGFSLLTVSIVTARADAPPVEIAAVLSMSGTYAPIGTMEARALDTAVRVANQNGGINGRPLTLHVFDDESDTGRAYMLADRVIAANQESAIIGGSTTPTCEAIHLTTAAHHVVQYCLSGGSLTDETYFSTFAHPQSIFGDLPAAFFAEHRLKRVVVIVPNSRAGEVYQTSLSSALSAHGLTLLSSTLVNSPEEATQATNTALHQRADVIYVGGNTDIEAATLHEIRRHHKKTTVWLADSATTNDEAGKFAGKLPKSPIYTAGDAIAVAAQLPASAPQRTELIRFWDTFAQYNNGMTPDTYAAIAADAARFVIVGLRNDGAIGGPALAQAIEHLPPTVGLYSTYQFSPEQHNGSSLSGIIIRLRHGGELQYAETLQQPVSPSGDSD